MHTLYRGQALTVQHNLRSVTIRHQLLLDQGLRELKCDIFSRQLLVDSCERLQLRERERGEGGGGRGREGAISNIVHIVKQLVLSIFLLICQMLTKSTKHFMGIFVSQSAMRS